MFYRLGLSMARWRRYVIGAWVLLVVASIPLAPGVIRVLSPGGFSSPDSESSQAIELLQRGLGVGFTSALVIFHSPDLTADDPTFIQQAEAAVQPLQGAPGVERILSFTLSPSQVSTDRHTAYTAIFLKSGGDESVKLLPEVRQKLKKPESLEMLVGGGPVFYADILAVTESDLRRAEIIAFPFAAVALILVFRSLAAAALPAIVGGFSVVVALAALYIFGSIQPVSVFALNLTTLFGLGLGVDYSLFLVSRFREELARGREVKDAVAVTLSTAGRAVLFSGLTVSIGLSGLVLFPLNMLRSVGLAGVITVSLSVLAALTLLPAMLSMFGHRVNSFAVRLPSPRGSRLNEPGTGFWHRLAVAVMARPLPVFVVTMAVLVLFGLPFASVRLAAPDASILPAHVESRLAYDVLSTQFDGSALSPVIVAVKTQGSPLEEANLRALDEYVRRLRADDRVERVQSIVSLDPRLTFDQYRLAYSQSPIGDPYLAQSTAALSGQDVTMVQVVSRYRMLDDRSRGLVQAIRDTPPPSGLEVLVDGQTAGVMDYVHIMYSQFPVALLLIALVTYVTLALLFRSLVLPLKAILMNVLSVLASYGALVFIFQEGNLSGLLNFRPLGFVEASTPILMFCALFGLSMDYEVFLLSRVREAYEATGDNASSVAAGMERSGSIITSAAAIVILVSLSFATADLVIVKALGVGMALAVLLDATLVRGLLVPATMRLLGNLNWLWPKSLDRLVPAAVFAAARESGEPEPSALATSHESLNRESDGGRS